MSILGKAGISNWLGACRSGAGNGVRDIRACPEVSFSIERAIRNRPEVIKSHSDFGHPEADLMVFRKEHGTANVAAIVERKNRYTVVFRKNDRRSKPIMSQLIRQLAPLPAQARQSLTFDRAQVIVSHRLRKTLQP